MSHDPQNHRMINSQIPREAKIKNGDVFATSLGDGAVTLRCTTDPHAQKTVTLEAVGDDAINQLSYILHTFLNTRAEDTPQPWVAVSDVLKFGEVLDQNRILEYFNSLDSETRRLVIGGNVISKANVDAFNARVTEAANGQSGS